MLHEFLSANRAQLIKLCRTKVAQRRAPEAQSAELDHGISLFIDQLIKTLQVEQTPEPMQSRKVSGSAGGSNPEMSEIGEGAALHGWELFRHGFTVDQVIHDYGDLCQAVTELAFESSEPIDADEFRTLNRCLDNAIAGAVTEFGYRRDSVLAEKQEADLNERLGSFGHELHNLIATASLALHAIKTGDVGVSGATGSLLERCLIGLRTLTDRSLAEVRLSVAMPVQHDRFSLAEFIDEVKFAALLEVQSYECVLTVSSVDPQLALVGDRHLLLSAVNNLLQNAFKFTRRNSEVALNAYTFGDRIVIDVADHCGGLSPDAEERMFEPFTQVGEDKTGLGLGLPISRHAVEENQGTLSVRNNPGVGCVFTIDLPRYTLMPPSS